MIGKFFSSLRFYYKWGGVYLSILSWTPLTPQRKTLKWRHCSLPWPTCYHHGRIGPWLSYTNTWSMEGRRYPNCLGVTGKQHIKYSRQDSSQLPEELLQLTPGKCTMAGQYDIIKWCWSGHRPSAVETEMLIAKF